VALIPCPECDKQVSDRARSCPHCGFPVAEEIGRLLAEVTGIESVRSVRQRLAANKLRSWGERYTESESKTRHTDALESGAGFGPRRQTIVVVAIAVAFVIVQLAILLSVVNR